MAKSITTRDNLLIYLKKNKSAWISGETLSRRLNVSRAAVNKHIKKLRQEGYPIESSTKKGYFLKTVDDLLLADEIQAGLDTRIFGKTDILVLKETDSTNLQAKNLAAEGAPEGTLVVAENQHAGRGRKGRTWFSPPGLGIYSSLILRPAISPAEAPGITLMTAVAAVEAVIALTGIPARIKWPNDIMVKNRKLAGILTEISTEMDSVDFIIVGFGMNVNTPADGFPSDIKEIATSVYAETGKRFPRVTMLQAFLKKFEVHYETFKKEGFSGVRTKWKALTEIIGKKVMVRKVAGEISGKVVDVDYEGVLILQDKNGETHRIFSGDLLF
ncbi:MAG: biotin--[acetyl-CoA-carboxylase] ligase [Desulfobacterales bacterium]